MKQLAKVLAITAVSAFSIAGGMRPAQALVPAVKGPWYGYYISSLNSSKQGSMSLNFTNQSGRQFNFIAMKDGRTYSEQGIFTNESNPYNFNFSPIGTESLFKGSGKMQDYGDGSVFQMAEYQEQKKDFRDQGRFVALRMFPWNEKKPNVMLPRAFKGQVKGNDGVTSNCSINFSFQEKSHAGGSMSINFARPVQVLCDGSVSNEKNQDGS